MKGEKFDKTKYCKTYADYVLFAIILVINQLKGPYKSIAANALKMSGTDSYGQSYMNSLDGYEAIINRRIEPIYRQACIERLIKAVEEA